MSVIRTWQWVLALLGVYAIVSIVGNAPFLGWGDDWAAYVGHAKALVEGRAYVDTGYVFNEKHPFYGPPFTPPGTPWLLVPAYAAWGFNLTALTGVVIACFTLSLACVYLMIARTYGAAMAISVVALLAFNPFLRFLQKIIVSEFPFLLWLYLAFLLVYVREGAKSAGAAIGYSLLIGLIIYLAYATRQVGAIALVALVLHDVLRGRGAVARVAPAVSVFVLCVMIQANTLTDTSGFSKHVAHESIEALRQGGRSIFINGFVYLNSVRDFFPAPLGLSVFMAVLLMALMIVGIAARTRATLRAEGGVNRESTLFMRSLALARTVPIEVFFAIGCLILLLVLPPEIESGARYLVPLVPLMFWYAAIGVQWLAERIPQRTVFLAILSALLVGYHVVVLFGSDRESALAWMRTYGPMSAAAQEMFTAVREKVPAGGMVVFGKPRSLALFSGRRSINWPADERVEALRDFLYDPRISHVVVARGTGAPPQPKGAPSVVAERADAIELFSNERFSLYRLR